MATAPTVFEVELRAMFNLFQKLFSSRPADVDQGVQLGERDCHCHYLPGVDDGSRNMEESLAILRLLQEAGVKRAIATPHIFPARYPNEPEALREVFAEVQSAVQNTDLHIELELGAEHYLDDAFVDRVRRGAILSFGPERYVLFETHTGPTTPAQLWDAVGILRKSGFVPLLAHVERYRWLRDEEDGSLELCEDLRSAGVRFQVNRSVGKVNRPGVGERGKFIAKIRARGWIDEVGSDLHRPTPEGRPYSAKELGKTGKKAGAGALEAAI